MHLDAKPVIRQVLFAPFLAALFFDVSGGPIGLEPLVSQSGPGMALLLILLAPIMYAIPSALMTAELASAYPVSGGYYVWVKEAFGEFCGFLCGFWTLVYTVIDSSLYPVLFSSALVAIARDQLHLTILQSGSAQHGLAIVIALVFTAVNVLGIRAVGIVSIILGVLTIAPFVIMVVMALPMVIHQIGSIGHPFVPADQTPTGAISAGLAVVIWNYMGWDSLSTTAEEVHNPTKTIRQSLMWAMPIVIAVYLFCTIAGLSVMPNYSEWEVGSWVIAAGRIGGGWLTLLIACALAVANCGMFSANILGISRVPQAFARDGLLPTALKKMHPKLGSPVWPVLLVAACVVCLVGNTFDKLVSADVLVYTLALLMEFGALFWLRVKAPQVYRPYNVPGGKVGVLLLGVPPLIVLVVLGISVYKDDPVLATWFAGSVLAAGPVAYGVACLYRVLVRSRRGVLPEEG